MISIKTEFEHDPLSARERLTGTLPEGINDISLEKGFWDDLAEYNEDPECVLVVKELVLKLTLISTEISEAIEALRCEKGELTFNEDFAREILKLYTRMVVTKTDVDKAMYMSDLKEFENLHKDTFLWELGDIYIRLVDLIIQCAGKSSEFVHSFNQLVALISICNLQRPNKHNKLF